VRRPPKALAAAAVVVVLVAVVYLFFVRDSVVAPHLRPIAPAATLGSGEDAVVVDADGRLLRWLKSPEGIHLPALPGDEEPKGGRLKGPMLEQAKILGAVPPALRRFVAGSRYGEDGVVVELGSGIELRFGDASQAERKWRAAATVLANPEVTALDYVNVSSPQHAAYAGEGHLLPTEP
jgi:hypothetical protein